MPLARQLTGTRKRPMGAGQVSDVTLEEYQDNLGCFRWISDEQEKEKAEAEAKAKAKASHDASQLAEHRRFRLHEIGLRRKRLVAQLRDAEEEFKRAEEWLTETRLGLEQAERDLAEAEKLLDAPIVLDLSARHVTTEPPRKPINRKVTTGNPLAIQ